MSNNHDIDTEKCVKKHTKKRLHKTKRIVLGFVIGIIYFVITAKIMSPSVTSGEAMSATDNQKYIFGFVVIYGLLTLIFTGILFYIKRYRIAALIVILLWVFGGLAGAAVLVYDTPSAVRYDALKSANSCVALLVTDSGYGTGFSTKSGFLVTNYHVVEGASSLKVHYSKDTTPIVAGFSKEMDITVLKISENIPLCRWADSSSIKVGAELYVVGWPYNPYGSPTVTKGIYSRTISSNDAVNVLGLSNSEYIQTDAVINPGNSGGPLSDSRGVVGINTAKLSSSDNSDVPEGIGYAISSNWAKTFVDNTISSYEHK